MADPKMPPPATRPPPLREALRAPVLPVPVAIGEPTDEYPYPWSVLPWFDGEAATRDMMADGQIDPVTAAVDLAGFIDALREVDTTGAPAPAPAPGSRGMPITPAG